MGWQSLWRIALVHFFLACIILAFCLSDGLSMIKDIDMTLINMERLYAVLILLSSV